MSTSTRTTRTRLTGALLVTVVGTALAVGTGVAVAQTDGDDDAAATTDVMEVLQTHLEEERMARDLYDALGEAHDGLVPFTHIEVSEQRHHDAVANLITAKDGTVPDRQDAGVYADAQIQSLYDGWLERGLVSPDAAYEVAVELETADIEHLRADIEEIDDADVDRVLGHLLTASEHHLAAFEAAATGELPEQMGPGRGMHEGMGPGQGMRQGMGPGRGMGPGEGMGPGMHRGDGTGDCPLTSTDDA